MKKVLLTVIVCVALSWSTVSFAEEEHDYDKEHFSRAEHQDHDDRKDHDRGKEYDVEEKHEGHDHGEHGDEHDEGFIEMPEKKAKKVGINISKAIKGDLNQTLVLPGEVTIDGDLLVHVAPRFEGTIKKGR